MKRWRTRHRLNKRYLKVLERRYWRILIEEARRQVKKQFGEEYI